MSAILYEVFTCVGLHVKIVPKYTFSDVIGTFMVTSALQKHLFVSMTI